MVGFGIREGQIGWTRLGMVVPMACADKQRAGGVQSAEWCYRNVRAEGYPGVRLRGTSLR